MAYFFIFNSSLNYEELVIIISTKITASWIIKKYLQASILGEMPWISAKIIFIMSIWAKRVDIRTDRDKEGINRWFWRQAVVKVWKFPPWRPYEINENRWVKHNGWVKHNSSTILLLMKNYLYRTIISWAISNARYIYCSTCGITRIFKAPIKIKESTEPCNMILPISPWLKHSFSSNVEYVLISPSNIGHKLNKKVSIGRTARNWIKSAYPGALY